MRPKEQNWTEVLFQIKNNLSIYNKMLIMDGLSLNVYYGIINEHGLHHLNICAIMNVKYML